MRIAGKTATMKQSYQNQKKTSQKPFHHSTYKTLYEFKKCIPKIKNNIQHSTDLISKKLKHFGLVFAYTKHKRVSKHM